MEHYRLVCRVAILLVAGWFGVRRRVASARTAPVTAFDGRCRIEEEASDITFPPRQRACRV